jgi:hypothetical protein
MSVPLTAAYDISVSTTTLLSASGFDFEKRRLFLSWVTYRIALGFKPKASIEIARCRL